MILTRRIKLDVTYEGVSFDDSIGAYIESISYTDSASGTSDDISITVNATDSKWINQWLPVTGSRLNAVIRGEHWTGEGDTRELGCGEFVVDDLNYSDTPNILTIGAVSKPADTAFSATARSFIWKNTSLKTIGETIAARNNLQFTFDADDYNIATREQKGSDSSFYNTLCNEYGLVFKVYSSRLYVYDRERLKEKPPVKTISKTDITRGSFSWKKSLTDNYTGGTLKYTNASKNTDISVAIGTDAKVLELTTAVASVQEAAVKLCSALNNANHSVITARFSLPGDFDLYAGATFALEGYETLDGTYYIDKISYSYSKSGFTCDIECSKLSASFKYWEVGGTIRTVEKYQSVLLSSPANYAVKDANGASSGGQIKLNNAPYYSSEASVYPIGYRSGFFFLYDGNCLNGRYRVSIARSRCGKEPAAENSIGWVNASDCTFY